MKLRKFCLLLSLLLLLSCLPAQTFAAAAPPSTAVKNYLQLGDYVMILPARDLSGKAVKYTNYSLSGQSGGDFNGEDVHMWKMGTANKWCVRRLENGAFSLITSNIEESQDVTDTKDIYFWDIEGKSTNAGANVHVWKDDDLNDDSKLFYLVDNKDGDPETFYIASYYTYTKNKVRYLAPEGFFSGTSWESDGCNTVLSETAFPWRVQIVSRESGNALPVDPAWMGGIPDCTPLASVNLPGAHDAAATNTGDIAIGDLSIARCQKLFFDEMLIAGIRALDIRLGEKDGAVVLNHSIVTCYHKDHGANKDKPVTLDYALKEVSAFLKAHPSETVVFVIKKDNGGDSVVTKALNILKNYQSVLYNWADPTPTLGDVRGKIVLMSRLEVASASYPKYLGPDLRNWDNNYNDNLHFAQRINATSSAANAANCAVFLQDDYSCSPDNKKLQFLNTAKQLAGKLGTTDGATPLKIPADAFVFNYSSIATSVHVATPLEGSHTMNTYLMKDLVSQGYWNAGSRMGIVMMDFADASLARLVADSNRKYTLDASGHVSTVKTTQPTCTEAGQTVRTCSLCGHKEVIQTVPALGHSYTYTDCNDGTHTAVCPCSSTVTQPHSFVNGICLCGAIEVTGPTADESITFGAQLFLENDLTMKFRVKADKLAAYDLSTVCLVVERDVYESGAKEAAVSTVTISDYTLADGRLVFTYPGIAAAQMNDAIRATLYIKDAQGKEYFSPTLNTSVATYLDGLLTASASDTQLVTLIMDMLNYGTAAQIYFDRHADAPVNAAFESFITYADYASADLLTPLIDLSGQIPTAGATATISQTLDLGTRVGITYKVTLPEGTDAAKAKLFIRDDQGNDLEVIDLSTGTVDSKGRYVVTFYGSSSRDMRRMVYAVVTANGRVVSNTYTYSISSYAHGVQENAAALNNPNLVNLTKAMILYGDSATEYFK